MNNCTASEQPNPLLLQLLYIMNSLESIPTKPMNTALYEKHPTSISNQHATAATPTNHSTAIDSTANQDISFHFEIDNVSMASSTANADSTVCTQRAQRTRRRNFSNEEIQLLQQKMIKPRRKYVSTSSKPYESMTTQFRFK